VSVVALPTAGAVPITQPNDPVQWLTKLSSELAARRTTMELMDRYYRGDHPLPFLTKAHKAKIRDQFSELLSDSRSNFMRLVVDVVEERLRVTGFRLSASADQAADANSWDIWQANQMDALSQMAFVEALVKGLSYASVWFDTDGDNFPDIAIEDPLQTIVGYEPGSNFRRRAAALKIWHDDWTGKERANVYLPNGIYKFERADPDAGSKRFLSGVLPGRDPRGGWKELEDEFVANPLGVIPIVPLRNRPRPLCEGESELCDVYRIQNQINGFNFLLALAGYFGAHRQRWVTGMAAVLDANGKPVEPFKVAVDRMFHAEDKDVKFGDFEQTDLTGYLKSTDQKVQHIAVTTRTPKHYLLPEGQEPSGDAIKSAEAGLVHKVQRKQRTFGEGLEEVLRLARQFAGEEDTPVDSEIIWADPAIRTEAEMTDAAVKKVQIGLISHAQALEDLGYSPQQIERMGASREAVMQPLPPSGVPAA
jgi:SPP1 Gp6-like portal protein